MSETMIQVVETAADETTARAIFDGLMSQVGCLGGRLLAPSQGYLSGTKILLGSAVWRIQVFFPNRDGWLMDGERRVLVLDSQRRTMGLL
jgi:hypothetical protein